MVILDTNMILRYLLNDNPTMAEYAQQAIQNGRVRVTLEVIAEVVYVLGGVYSASRQDIRKSLCTFLEEVDVEEKDVLRCALNTYASQNLDFVDCVLYAYHQVYGHSILTFDKKLNKLLNAEG